MQERHKCGCEVNNKQQEMQLKPIPCNSHSACSHLRLTDENDASMGCGACKALFVEKNVGKKDKEKPLKERFIHDPGSTGRGGCG